MSKLKKGRKQLKISKQKEQSHSAQYISLTFAHVTTNKQYNFHYFGKNIRQELDARKALDELLKEISDNDWIALAKRRKDVLGGFERLYLKDITSIPIPNMVLTEDTEIYIFRFGKADAFRLCCVKDLNSVVLHVIAYDFNYSLYNHGT